MLNIRTRSKEFNDKFGSWGADLEKVFDMSSDPLKKAAIDVAFVLGVKKIAQKDSIVR